MKGDNFPAFNCAIFLPLDYFVNKNDLIKLV